MRICVVEPRSSGGMIHYAYQLCNALSCYATDVTLVTARDYELDGYPHKFKVKKLLNLWKHTEMPSSVQSRNRIRKIWSIVYRNGRRIIRGIRYIFWWIKLTNYLIKLRPDIVQFGEIEFPFEAIFLHYLKSRGIVLSQICHEFEPREDKPGLMVTINNRLLKSVFRSFSILFFHSKNNQERFSELNPDIPAERFRLIPMGSGSIFPRMEDDRHLKLALMDRYHFTGSEMVVLFFGNITPSKGVPNLLAAFTNVYARNSRARLVIAGMPLKYIDVTNLLDMAKTFGIEAVTQFDFRYLPIEEVGPLMDLATVVVFPYVTGTQSASIQAAYACGKPVIATRVGGLPDVVVEGLSGFVVAPNSPDELGNAILKIIEDPYLTTRMGKFARELSRTQYSWEPIAECIAGVYQSIF